jgi:tetratricopeptide (TPR) repeat protein
MSADTNKTQKRCFVVMGFGTKTDLATGRQLDLNKSYKILIKPVVESRGLKCIRADEIQHAGPIDLYMYQELLDADIVIADISTANVNAFYELGIRHALRRRTTIVISEDKLAYPFDLNHIKITSYTHLGAAIDYEEVERFRKVLGETIDSVLKLDDPDSPVYTHLHELIPPSIKKKAAKAMQKLEGEIKDAISKQEDKYNSNEQTNSLSVLIEKGEKALSSKDYNVAKIFFQTAIDEMNKDEGHKATYDPYLVQRLALATYKAKEPDTISSLKEAITLLDLLDLKDTNDTETVTLAGKIEKRLYFAEQGVQHLINAIDYYERGYYLFRNRYHAINLAFLLNNRADSSLYNTTEDKITDMIWANRIRRKVLEMCEINWNEIEARANRPVKQVLFQGDRNLSSDQSTAENEQKFWILVNKAEAHFGLGEIEEYKKAVEKAKEIPHTQWMWKSFEDELNALKILMAKLGHFVNPPWRESA